MPSPTHVLPGSQRVLPLLTLGGHLMVLFISMLFALATRGLTSNFAYAGFLAASTNAHEALLSKREEV